MKTELVKVLGIGLVFMSCSIMTHAQQEVKNSKQEVIKENQSNSKKGERLATQHKEDQVVLKSDAPVSDTTKATKAKDLENAKRTAKVLSNSESQVKEAKPERKRVALPEKKD